MNAAVTRAVSSLLALRLWRGVLLAVLWSVTGLPALSLADFTVLGTDGAWLQLNSRVTSGDVSVNRASTGPFLSDGVELTFGPGARVDQATSVVYGPRVSLNISAQVYDLHTNQVSGIGTILGHTNTPLTLPVVGTLPAIPAITPGTHTVTVPLFRAQTLAPGRYAAVTVGTAGTLTLTGGLYELASLTVGNSAKVYIAAPTELRIAGRVHTEPIARIEPAPGTTLTAADLFLVVTGHNGNTGALTDSPKAVSFGQATTLRGKVWAPNGTVELQQNSVGTGAFLGKWVILGPGVFAHFEGGFGLGIGGADTIPPVVTAPNDIIVPAQHSSGIFISHPLVEAFLNGATAVDDVDGVLDAFPDSPYILPLGQTVVTFTARDAAGNRGTATATITVVDLSPPVITVPSDIVADALDSNGTPMSDVTIQRFLREAQAIDNVDGELSLTHDAPDVFPFGATTVTFSATDRAGNTGVETAVVTVVDMTPPVFSITSPADFQVFTSSPITLTGTIDDSTATLLVNGVPATVNGGNFTIDSVALQEGANTLTVIASDMAGNTSQSVIQVSLINPPVVTITDPLNMAVVNAETLNVTGTVDTGGSTVSVNGIAASVSGGSFTVSGVPIREGLTVLTAEAINAAGSVGTTMVQVIRDASPPRVTILSPGPGEHVTTPTVTVSGTINDNVAGTIHEDNMTVTVNGQAAVVANRSFVAVNVPVSLGSNTLTVLATDSAGNMGQVSSAVTREAAAGKSRILIDSGNGQTGVIGNALPDPLVVKVLDANGSPVENQQVIFRVKQNDGTISTTLEQKRALVTTTDSQGFAQVSWTLGSRAGAANNRVEATAVGFVGKAVFLATALAGPADKINVDAGNNQVGLVGRTLTRPFTAIVTDTGHNRLGNIPVTFTVVEGGGYFNGQSSITTMTDNDGRALAVLTSGFQEGIDNNRVRATFSGNTGFPASFTASGRVAGDPSATQISGVVLDNTDQPVPGVTLTVAGTALTTQSDAQGQFVLAPAPVGPVHLLADGSTAQRPGTWPNLEYELVTLPGQDNTLGMPIYLLPLDIPNGLFVDETTGGTLTLPQVPGFALTIGPGSATFPGGSRSGTVSVTVVHADKVPMTPNFGQQPRFILTIQPPGVHFDPPAAMTMPNTDGLAPGHITELYSFDHDLGQFVSIGTGTVSDDGTTVISDPGVGIVKGGWHCGGDPASTGSAGHCPECQICDGDECLGDPAQDKQSCSKGAGENNIACCVDKNCTPCPQDMACQGVSWQCGGPNGCLEVTSNDKPDCSELEKPKPQCGTKDTCKNTEKTFICEHIERPEGEQLRQLCLANSEAKKNACVKVCTLTSAQEGCQQQTCATEFNFRNSLCKGAKTKWVETCIWNLAEN